MIRADPAAIPVGSACTVRRDDDPRVLNDKPAAGPEIVLEESGFATTSPPGIPAPAR